MCYAAVLQSTALLMSLPFSVLSEALLGGRPTLPTIPPPPPIPFPTVSPADIRLIQHIGEGSYGEVGALGAILPCLAQ